MIDLVTSGIIISGLLKFYYVINYQGYLSTIAIVLLIILS